MDCASCGRANRAGAKFCNGCGRPLAARCPACGVGSASGAQFCDACGASLLATPAGAGAARKTVTIVFADLIGSTALHERLDAESARRFMERYYAAMRGAVEAHGGRVTQLLGDGVKAVFGAPRVAEDDAIRAVRAAVEMQRAFREIANEQLAAVGQTGLRVAVNTGEVVATDETEIIGDPVNVAARLQEEARDGGVVIGEATRRLVSELVTLAPLGSFSLKGRSEAVAAYRVVSLERPAGAAAIAFVGREDELARITAVYDGAVTARAARLAVLLGSPGLGKSRLIDEFTRRLGDAATVLLAHCDAAGSATFAPLADALRGLLRIDDGSSGDALRAAVEAALPDDEPERARIASGIAALLAGAPASPEEIFFVVRRLLAAFAAARPLVLAIDDIQWAEPLLLDLIEHLVQWGGGVRLFVLAAARPELRDARSSLATPGGLVSDVVTLAGLDAGAAARLAANVIGAEALPAAIAGRVLATSEGNPLFVGELVRMLVHDGALKREGDRWTTGVALADVEMPPTIHALLSARIERLRPEERTLLERAAVIGRHFSRTALAQLLPREIGDLDARLEALRRSELIESDTGWFLGDPALRFHHVLIRDAAYRRLLKNTRAELHGRFADWLEARAAGSVEHDEMLGWHLEQAHQLLLELGPIDAQGRALGERAARHLAAAGRRALARDDLTPAASLLERALARLDAVDPARADLTLDWCEALLSAGDVATAARAIAELGRFAPDSDRLRAWHTCFSGQLAVLTDPKALRASSDAVEAAAAALTFAGDAAGEAKAHAVHALVLAQLGKIGLCETALDKALAAARRAHDRRRANAVLAGAPVAALWGPSPVTRASGRCLDVVRVLRITQGAPAVEAVALRCQAVLETLRGRAEAARRMIASSRRMVEELGITQRVLEADLFAGLIELLEGDATAAERSLRVAWDGLRAQGLGIDAAQAAALLGRALLAQGRVAEAEAISLESEALAGDSFKAAIAWRGVRAEALAARGEHAAAIEFARAAIEIAAATDDLLDHADARQALAVALRAAGRSVEAGAEEKRAIELWEAKGATLLVERARSGATRSIDPPRSPAPSAFPAQTVRRRVRPNAATALMARSAAAIEARDAEAVAALHSDAAEYVDHASGVSYGREGFLASLRSLSKARELTFRQEPLAVLGGSLALARRVSSASGVASTAFDVAAYEREAFNLFEVDGESLVRRFEVFAPDRLGNAIARLYERYAELLPDGPEHTRAAATARAVAPTVTSYDVASLAAALAPDIEYVDRRSVRVIGSARGAETFVRGVASLLELSGDIAMRVDDVLALQTDALLLRVAQVGTDRVGGGTFERQFLRILVFGSKGLLTRCEEFDADRDSEALARIDELTAEPPRSERRVPANAATAAADRLGAAFAARDTGALVGLYADGYDSVEHLTGAAVGREGALATLHALLRSSGPGYRCEHLATLGELLALERRWWSSEATRGGRFDVAASEQECIGVCEVDERGRFCRGEFFAADRLGDAVARFYERYAELLPDGPERTRAAATARSVAAMLGPPVRGRGSRAFAPSVEFVDHRLVGSRSLRGAEALIESIGALRELSDDFTTRVDDVLGLRSDALLVRWKNSGTLRDGGGVFERDLCHLWIFDADGLLARREQFDADGEAEALARFDELATAAAPARPLRRRVRPNAATANAARLEAAIAARDGDALPTLFADRFDLLDHTNAITYDRQASLTSWRALLRVQEPAYQQERLATLGEPLALYRESWSGIAGGKLDAGAFERERIVILEVDAQGLRRRAEIFATDHLGDAVVRLYERYAELLPDGPDRTRAVATAQSVAAWLQQLSDRFAAVLAPGIRFVDHRPIGMGSARGAEAFFAGHRAQHELARDIVLRIDDILALCPDALLLRSMTSGIDRASGGAYERPLLLLGGFDPEGRLACVEWFDADADTEALPRFDELTAEPPRSLRRVRPNAATAHVAREDAEFAARDGGAILSLFAADVEVLDHPIGAVLGRPELVASLDRWLRVPDLTRRHVPLATLGDALALCRMSMSASGVARGSFDVGTYEAEAVVLFEVDAKGRFRRGEIFADDRRGDAICRLYERYAELLPDGRARARAATIARSAAAMLGTPDLDQLASAFAPDIETVDHRSLGTWSARGAEAALQHFRSLLEVAGEIAMREYEVLCLQSDALLVRRTHCGIDRASGGAYERRFVMLLAFGGGGRIARIEWFEPDDDSEALARFDALTAGPPRSVRRVRPNVATANLARGEAAIAARDSAALPALFSDDYEAMDHTTGTGWDRKGVLVGWRSLMNARDPLSRHEPLATLGDSLTLYHSRTSASKFTVGDLDVGAFERVQINVMEVDAQGRRRRWESFAANRLGDAVARLYERYAELLADGPERARATATARSFAASGLHAGAVDLERLRTALAPDLVHVDARTAGLGTTRGAEAFLRGVGALLQLSEGLTLRLDDLLDLRADAVLMRASTSGTDRASGGAFERPFLLLLAFGSDGLVSRWEQFNLDREADALARFDALTVEPAVPTIENAVTRLEPTFQRAWEARDWEAFAALYPAHFRSIDRRPLMHLEVDRDELLAGLRPFFEMGVMRSTELLATRGERLALYRMRLSGTVGLTGPSEVELLQVTETDANGQRSAGIAFGPDDLDGAYAELDARYHAGEAAPCTGVSAGMMEFKRSFAARDWDALAARCAPDLVTHDHRLLGWESLHGPAAYVEALRALVELAPDTRLRIDHASICESGYFVLTVWEGTREGGAYEAPSLMVAELDAAGRIRRFDQYDLERLEAARARYAELRPDPLRIPPNAAARAIDRWRQHTKARDLASVAELLAPSFVFEDRRRLVRDSGDRDKMLASVRIAIASGVSLSHSLLATAGDRLALVHQDFSISDGGRQLSEIEALLITEVDAEGRVVATVAFDPDDRRGASVEMFERYFRGEGARFTPRSAVEVVRALNEHDLDRLRAALPDEYYFHDRRRTGVGRIGSADGYVASLRAVFEQSADATTDTLYHVAVAEHGSLGVGRMFGTLDDGGAFETLLVRLSLYRDGRSVGTELFEIEDLDLARARFDALRPDPLRIPPNSASRTKDRWQEAFEKRDWVALGNLCAPALVFEDRRRSALTSGDREMFLRSARIIASSNPRVTRALLASAGDRLALEYVFWEATDGTAFQVESLSLWEVDAEGRVIATLFFNPDDRRAASAELLARDPRRDAVARAMSDHDLPRLRATLPADFACHDRRRTGLGKLEGADDYIASLAALFEQAPDVIIEPLYTVAAEKHGNLSIVRMYGTLADGGAFESVMLRLASLRGGEIVGLELFEPEDLDAARARFDELRPDPLRIPANAATRACDRWLECIVAADWDALQALCAPIEFEDRRRLNRTSGACDMVVASSKVIAKLGGRASRNVLATAGDRLSLERVLWTADDAGAVSEVETLQITEVDAAGHVVAAIIFEPDDRRDAFDALHGRFAAGEAAATGGQAPVAALVQAFTRHDWDALRACLADDAVVHDHRTLGVMGALSGNDWIESRRVLAELAPDVREETLRILVWNRRGRVSVGRLFGVTRDGGSFENLFVGVYLTDGDRIERYEFFDVDAADRAVARFEELCDGTR